VFLYNQCVCPGSVEPGFFLPSLPLIFPYLIPKPIKISFYLCPQASVVDEVVEKENLSGPGRKWKE
jgi:hypothetical protein